MIVAGIDPSLTSAGIAVLRDGIPVMLESPGHVHKGIKNDHNRNARIFSQANAITVPLIGKNRRPGHWPDLVVLERPLTFGPSKSADGYDRYALFVIICCQFAAKKVPYAVVHNQTRASWATGKGEGVDKGKGAVLARVREDWFNILRIANHDIADALTLAAMGALHLGDPLPIPVPEWRINGLKSVTWPEVVTHA